MYNFELRNNGNIMWRHGEISIRFSAFQSCLLFGVRLECAKMNHFSIKTN